MRRLSGIRLDLQRDFGRFRLDVDLELPGKGLSILYGSSGSGKTTLLRCVAGLEKEMAGKVSVNGEVWFDSSTGVSVPTFRRPIGFVFQDAALFPHLTVRDNLCYGMNRSVPLPQTASFVHVVELLALEPHLGRYPEKLSGGEMQRVAIARALLTQPRLLLMDEPLASLDANLKRDFLPYLEKIHRELEIPVIYVTHAPDEVMRLADHVALLDQGCVTAAGPLDEMMALLASRPGFGDGMGAVISATVEAHHAHDGITEVRFEGGRLWMPLMDAKEGSPLRCRILPSDVSLSIEIPASTSILNTLPVTVESVSDSGKGANLLVYLKLKNGPRIFSLVTHKSARDLALKPGMPVYALIKATTLGQ